MQDVCVSIAAQPAWTLGGRKKENMTPATHMLPPSLNYWRRVAHTAGEEETEIASRGREGSGRER